jgi:transketolase
MVVDVALTVRAGLVAIENHSVIGGLGSAVAEALAEAGVGRRLIRLGVQDTYAHGASRAYLFREHGLDAAALVRAVEDLLGVRLGMTDAELAPAGDVMTPAVGATKVEDL